MSEAESDISDEIIEGIQENLNKVVHGARFCLGWMLAAIGVTVTTTGDLSSITWLQSISATLFAAASAGSYVFSDLRTSFNALTFIDYGRWSSSSAPRNYFFSLVIAYWTSFASIGLGVILAFVQLFLWTTG